MPTTKSFLRRQWERVWLPLPAIAPNGATAPAQNPPIIVGIYQERGQWRLCDPEYREPGTTVYLTTIGRKLFDQYAMNLMEYDAIQAAIADTPKSLRPRRRKVANG